MARSWAEALPALRDHPLSRTFVPVAMRDAECTVAVFPTLFYEWAKRNKPPRMQWLCTRYAEQAVDLLNKHWPLNDGEVPDVAGAGVGALRFVIYFAERGIPAERHYEFLLAEHVLQNVRDQINRTTDPEEQHFARACNVAKGCVKLVGQQGPFVLRHALPAIRLGEPQASKAFRLNVMLHDTMHVLAACDLALVPLRVWRTERSDGKAPSTRGTLLVDGPVRVAWPGLVYADKRLHLLMPSALPIYVRRGSCLPLVRPSTAKQHDEAKSDAMVVALFNVGALASVCASNDLLDDAMAHRAPPLLEFLPAPSAAAPLESMLTQEVLLEEVDLDSL